MMQLSTYEQKMWAIKRERRQLNINLTNLDDAEWEFRSREAIASRAAQYEQRRKRDKKEQEKKERDHKRDGQ